MTFVLLFNMCVHVCLCAYCVCVCSCSCVNACGYACMWGPQVNFWSRPQKYHLSHLRQGLLLAWGLPTGLDWLASDLQGSSYLHPDPSSGVISMCYYAQLLTWIAGALTEALVLAKQVLCQANSLPSPPTSVLIALSANILQ